MSAQNQFAAAAAAAVADALDMDASAFPVGAPPKPAMGDFAVGCFPAARVKKAPPPKLAAEVAAGFEPTELLDSASAAGPFVNFKANREALYRYLVERRTDDNLATAMLGSVPGAGQTVCIDYSSPNISKHLAYHHIRSTVIGHALVNLYRAVGYKVIGVNHLGDWGTTHGMLIAAYKKWGLEDVTVNGLNDLYVRWRAAMKQDPTLEDEGRAWFKKLEDGDSEARNLWNRFRDVSLAEFQSVYRTLGITFEEIKGESEYEDRMQPVIDMLEEKGLTEVSKGALVVPLGDDMPPLLLRKQDGATLYGTRDLAAAMYRWETYGFARSLYVVDRGQGVHFKQLFSTLARAGFDWADRCAHVPFGLVRVGGKKTGTRAGNVVLLKNVLAEAAERSKAIVAGNNPDWSADQVASVASQVGVGAIVFANLVSDRNKDVDFEWEQVLSSDGDSGPYVQYGHARTCSALDKAGAIKPDSDADLSLLQGDEEWALARKLIDYGEAVARAADGNDPHLLSRYLLELTATFHRLWTAGTRDGSLRLIVDDADLTRARITLVDTTRAVLAHGLSLLGLQAPPSM